MTVYTCVTGNIDRPTLERGIAYVDKKHWLDCEVRKPPDVFVDPRRNARMVKILSHQFIDDEWSLWVDGNVRVHDWDFDYFKQFGDLVVMRHQHRDCVYEEAEEVIRQGKDDEDVVIQQMARYQREGYPKHNGLLHSSTILRHHTPEIVRFNNLWWSEVCRHSVRDQLSFNYAAWKSGVKIAHFPSESSFEVRGHGIA